MLLRLFPIKISRLYFRIVGEFHYIGCVSAMEKYVCVVCGYVYDPAQGDPDNGVAPGTSFEDVPEDWVCPLCGVGKDQFEKEE